MFPSIKSDLCSSILIIVTLVLANGGHLILATNRAIPTKADCVDLWNVVSGPGSGAMGRFPFVNKKNFVVNYNYFLLFSTTITGKKTLSVRFMVKALPAMRPPFFVYMKIVFALKKESVIADLVHLL